MLINILDPDLDFWPDPGQQSWWDYELLTYENGDGLLQLSDIGEGVLEQDVQADGEAGGDDPLHLHQVGLDVRPWVGGWRGPGGPHTPHQLGHLSRLHTRRGDLNPVPRYNNTLFYTN